MDITSELTIVIPVRIDCRERKENLDAAICSLLGTTHSSIIVLEAGREQKYSLSQQDERVKCFFIQDDDPIFHRTRYLNILLKLSQTNIVAIWDADVIVDAKQINEAADAVKKGTTLSYPYNGRFLFLSKEQSNDVKNDVISFSNDTNKDKVKTPTMGRPSVGGAFIVNKQRYLQAGGENENFYGWGSEDAERFKRMEILEEPISRASGALYHLYHPRGVNSTFGNDERDKNNVKELIKICGMNTIQLKGYIDTWNWKE